MKTLLIIKPSHVASFEKYIKEYLGETKIKTLKNELWHKHEDIFSSDWLGVLYDKYIASVYFYVSTFAEDHNGVLKYFNEFDNKKERAFFIIRPDNEIHVLYALRKCIETL